MLASARVNYISAWSFTVGGGGLLYSKQSFTPIALEAESFTP